jgi:peptide/nickel transport system permease protein
MTLRGSRLGRVISTDPARRLAGSPIAALSVGFLLLVVVSAVLAPLLAPQDPLIQDLLKSREPPFWWPGAENPLGGLFGTDSLGRDLFSRILYGSRVSLIVGVAAVGLSMAVGIPLGLIAGYREGVVGDLIMRAGDALVAIPTLFLAISIIVILGPDLKNLIIVLATWRWVVFARVVRADVLRLKQEEYIVAARSLGFRPSRILVRHILPNIGSPLIVLASLSLAEVILAEAALSFLGMGVQPPTPTWGGMLAEARDYLGIAPWMALAPGVAITTTILAINLVGDWLRDVLDPRLRDT